MLSLVATASVVAPHQSPGDGVSLRSDVFFVFFFWLHSSWIARRPAGRASWGLLQEGFLLLGDYIKKI